MGDLKRWQKLALWAADRFPKNKISQDLAYKIISDRQVGYQAGATTKDVVRNVFSSKSKDEDTNKYMFVYGADTRRPETTIGQAYDWSKDIKENGYENVKTYRGVLNPYNEYLVDSRNKGLVEEFAKVGYSPVSNINNEYIDWNTYRLKQGTPYFDDVHSYRPTFHFNNGQPVISSSDLYDFGKNYVGDFADLYAERSGSEKDPAFTMELQRRALNAVGQPYRLVQKNIPIRFVDNPQGNEIWRTNNFNKELRLDEMSDREISDILHTGYIEPSVVTAYKKGGRIHIKKKNRGKFTAAAKRAGMGVQEFARHVLANKDKYSPTLVKRANFARNSKKFKHENGGILKYQNPAGPFLELKDTLNTNYLAFKKTLPDNLRLTPEKDYHMYDYWRLSGEPKNFREGKRRGMFTWDRSDKGYHAGSIAEDRNTGIYHFMKPKHHPTVKYELDWFNKGLQTLEGGKQVPVEGKDKEFWEDFTSKYQLDTTGVDYQYVPIKKNGGILKAQGGAKNPYAPDALSPIGIALNQAKAMAKMKGEQHLPPGVKEVVGPDGKKVAIRTEQPLVSLEQDLAEWLPGTGDVAEVGYIANDVKNGNYGSAILAAAMVALPGNVGKVFRKSDVPASKLTEAERLGIPKGERNQPLNGHLKGDAAVQMFKEYGTTTIPSNSKIYSQIQQLVPEARERYKLVGRTDITDDEIAGSLYKRAMELNDNGNAAVWTETGEPRLLFRGDTRRYNRLMDKWSPEKLAKGEGTMDNSLGNLFLGDISGKGQGVDRYFISGTDFFEPRIQGSATGARGKFGTIFDGGGEGVQGTVIPYIPKDAYELATYQTVSGPYSLYKFPGKYSESGISDLNAFITRTPAMRDATGEISVLADDIVMKTKNYRGPNIDDYDGPTYDGVNSTVRDAMAKHYQSVLDDAQSKGQGLLFSEGLTDEYVKKFGEIHPFRREHEWYDYYALPNFNRQNAKHLFGWDLRRPVQWDIDNIYLEKGGKL